MADQWAIAQRLIGHWEGPATGRPGTGYQVREYQPVLRGRFILGTDVTRWDPSSEHPDGDVHEDLAVIDFEKAAASLVMRGFYSEGFVHEYRCVEAADDGSRLVFEADVKGGPEGMRARETMTFVAPDVLESRFELAMPGGDFESYTFERLARTPG
jgi:hypothetical protein